MRRSNLVGRESPSFEKSSVMIIDAISCEAPTSGMHRRKSVGAF